MSQQPASLIAPAPAGNYFLRHWRGELPLRLSFWGNGFLPWLGFFLAILLLSPNSFYDVAEFRVPRGILIGLYYPIELWQLVGISRAALRYQRDGGDVRWATFAQLMVILACFRIFSGLVMGTYW